MSRRSRRAGVKRRRLGRGAATCGCRPALLGFDRDGAAWVVRPAGVVERVEVPTGKVTRTVKLPFDNGAWGRLVLSPDGRWLAVGGGTTFAVRRTAADADWVIVSR